MKQSATLTDFEKAQIELAQKVSHMGISITPEMVKNYMSQQQKAA
tara:strand:- start:1609 stop:1743 length:135 start_codon:yes stop_codon:yes gene_type:complete